MTVTSSKTRALQEPVGRLEPVPAVCVEPKTRLADVYEAMRKASTGCVIVAQGGKAVGIFTERDFVMKVAGLAGPETPVEKVMTKDPVTATPKTTIGQAIELMHGGKFRNLPVLDEKKRPAGLLTVNRIIKYLAALYPVEVYNLPPKPDQVEETPEGG